MQNNNPNDFTQENEIDLKEVIKLLINSKKLIITITLVITTLSTIYTLGRTPEYQSTALVEIGQYDTLDNENILIESASNLIQNLNILFIYKSKNNESLNIKTIEDKLDFKMRRLIAININKPSIELGVKTLNEITRYIENRHSLLLNKIIQKPISQLAYEIKRLEDQIKIANLRISNRIKITNSTLASLNEVENLRISNEIDILNNRIPTIDKQIKSLNDIITADKNNLLLLNSSPSLLLQRTAQTPTLDQVIFSYVTKVIDLKYEKIKLSQEKDSLENQLKSLESNNLEANAVFISQEKDSLEDQLKRLESNNRDLKAVLKLSQEKDSLELKLEFLMKQNPINTKSIGEIVSKQVNHGALLIFIAFIVGLFLSIFTVLINNSFKTFIKEGL